MKSLLMKELTTRQELFAQGLAAGKTQIQAYKDAGYSQGDYMTNAANASRLANNDKVKARVQTLLDEEYSKKIMPINERKARLSQFAREEILSKHGQPIRTSNIQAIAELNRMDSIGTTQINVNIEDLKIAILNAKQDDSKLIAENKPKLGFTESKYSPENE